MNNDAVVRQLRHIKQILDQSPRDEDENNIVLDGEAEADMRDSVGRALEALTGKPRN